MRRALSSSYRLLQRLPLLRRPFGIGALAAALAFPGLAGTAPSFALAFARFAGFALAAGCACELWAWLRRSRSGRGWRAAAYQLPWLALIPVLSIPFGPWPQVRALLALACSALFAWKLSRTVFHRRPALRDAWQPLRRGLAASALVCLAALGALALVGGA